jgi:hypothetical protein
MLFTSNNNAVISRQGGMFHKKILQQTQRVWLELCWQKYFYSTNKSKICLLSADRNIFYFADRWNRCLLLGFRNRCRHNSVASTRRTLPCTSKKLIQIQTIYEIEYLFATFIGINFGTLMFHNVSTVNCVSSFLKDSWNSEVFTQFNS